MLISGRSVSEQASCPNAAGSATVQVTVQDLPPAFANAPVSCKYVPWRTLQGLRDATKQVGGTLLHFMNSAKHAQQVPLPKVFMLA